MWKITENPEWVSISSTKGKVLIFGPVLDPTDNFGMGVLEVDDIAEAERCLAQDPTVLAGMNRFRISPMMVGAARAKEQA